MTTNRLALALACSAAFSALAAPPDACKVVTIDDVNAVAGGAAAKISPRRSGNPSECAFEDSRRGAVLVLHFREVQFAPENELQHERENLEKIYRSKVKWVQGIADNAFWLEANRTAMFRKGRLLASVTFAREKNANEADTLRMVRMVESRLP